MQSVGVMWPSIKVLSLCWSILFEKDILLHGQRTMTNFYFLRYIAASTKQGGYLCTVGFSDDFFGGEAVGVREGVFSEVGFAGAFDELFESEDLIFSRFATCCDAVTFSVIPRQRKFGGWKR